MTAEFSSKSNVEDVLRTISKELSTLPSISSVAINLEPISDQKTNGPVEAEQVGDENDDQINF